MTSFFANFTWCSAVLLLLTAGLYAAVPEPGKVELLERIRLLEEQNASLAVQATRYQMEAEDYRNRYKAAVGQGPAVVEETPRMDRFWKAEVSLGATASSGNNNSYQVNLAAKATRSTRIDELILALSADLGENENVKTSEKGKASADYRHDIDTEGRWYWLLLSSLERDQLSDLDYRLTLGTGAGYRFWNTKKFKLSLESGPAFVAEKNSNDPVDYSVRGRVGNRMEYQMTGFAKLFQASEILFNLQDSEDYLINNEAGIESSLTKVLSLRVFGKHRYDHLPAAGKEENDFSLISALVYKFE